jgi:hypothetical protein
MASVTSGGDRGQSLKRVTTDLRSNRRDVGGGRFFLMSIGDLYRDPLKKLIAKPGETTRWNWIDHHVEIFRSDDDGWSSFV